MEHAAVSRWRRMAAVFFAAAAGAAHAQGGPPMLTDDPGTPGDGKWEINIASVSEHARDATTFELPLLDVNYGVGERFQIKFEVPWVHEHSDGHHVISGAGNSLAGVKWRFFDAGEDGWQISTYPQVESRFPGGGSAFADRGVSYLLPLEFEHRYGAWGVNFDVGRWLRPARALQTWIGGVAVGRDFGKDFEFIGELHDEADVHSGRDELTINFGMRWKWSERLTLLASAGADLHNGLDDRIAPLTYVGIQLTP
jgi:hypothetical protein